MAKKGINMFDPNNPPKFCPKCQKKGIKSKVKMRRLCPGSEKVLICKSDLCTWPYTPEEIKDLYQDQSTSQHLASALAQSTPLEAASKRKRSREVLVSDETPRSPKVRKAKEESNPTNPKESTQPVLPTLVSSSNTDHDEAVGGEKIREGEQEDINFARRKDSKMKSYGGRNKNLKIEKEQKEELRYQEDKIQKAWGSLKNRKEMIDLNRRSPSPEILRVGRTEKKYRGSQPRKFVRKSAPMLSLSKDNQKRLDCSPTRKENVTIVPARTDLGEKQDTLGQEEQLLVTSGNGKIQSPSVPQPAVSPSVPQPGVPPSVQATGDEEPLDLSLQNLERDKLARLLARSQKKVGRDFVEEKAKENQEKIKKKHMKESTSFFEIPTMEEKSHEDQKLDLDQELVPVLGFSETATSITIEDGSLWKEIDTFNDNLNVNLEVDLFSF